MFFSPEKKEHNALILVSVQAIFGFCSKQFQGTVQVLLVLCKFPPPRTLPWSGEQGAATDGI